MFKFTHEKKLHSFIYLNKFKKLVNRIFKQIAGDIKGDSDLQYNRILFHVLTLICTRIWF